MHRETLEQIIDFENINTYPKLPCPYCNQNSLYIDENSINYRIDEYNDVTKIIKKERKENFELVGDIYKENNFFGVFAGLAIGTLTIMEKAAKFISFFTCKNCNKQVSATGTMKLNREEDINSASIKVEYFSPPIPLFNLSSNIPEDIREELIQSFNHFHSDISSSGSKLRRAVEKMCANLGFKEKI